MEIVVGVAIGALVVVILFTAVGIICVLQRRLCKKSRDLEADKQSGNNPEKYLIDDDFGEEPITIDNVMADEIWLEDASGVMNHCIPILKDCYDLTSRLVPVTEKQCSTDEQNKQVIEMARKVTPRIDDVVHLMEGPIDPRVVEARCTALYYAVSNLVLTIKGICKDDGLLDWADIALKEIEKHLVHLQEESERMRRRSMSNSLHADSEGLSSPGSSYSASAASTSKGSTHTDSAESGIDVNPDMHLPTDVKNSGHVRVNGVVCKTQSIDGGYETQDNSSIHNSRKPTSVHVAEVHREQDTTAESLEMESIKHCSSNQAFIEEDTLA